MTCHRITAWFCESSGIERWESWLLLCAGIAIGAGGFYVYEKFEGWF